MIDESFVDELAAARSAVEELARAGDLPAGVALALGDLVRLIDALETATSARLNELETSVEALKSDAHRLQADVRRREGAASAAGADAQSLRTSMRGFDQREKKLDQRISLIAGRVTALEARH